MSGTCEKPNAWLCFRSASSSSRSDSAGLSSVTAWLCWYSAWPQFVSWSTDGKLDQLHYQGTPCGRCGLSTTAKFVGACPPFPIHSVSLARSSLNLYMGVSSSRSRKYAFARSLCRKRWSFSVAVPAAGSCYCRGKSGCPFPFFM